MTTTGAETLKGQVAVVTGGGRGIGRSVSLRLAALGASVAVNYSKSAAHAEQVVSEIRSLGGTAEAVCFDVADEGQVEAGFKQVLDRFERIDVLVNNAGIAIDGLLVRTKAEDWAKIIGINLTGCFYCSKAVAKTMMRARSGRIINVSSVIGEMGNAGQGAYSASKSGIFGLTKSLARELGSRAITVNAITPGYIQTDMTAELSGEQTQKILEQIPLGRLGTAEDVAELIAFLCQPAAGYITGQVIAVNGGMYM